MNRKLPSWLAICLVCVCGGLLVYLVHGATADRIQRQSEALAQAPRAGVLPAAERFEAAEYPADRYGLEGLYEGLDADGNTVGYVGETIVKGYRSPIRILAGVDMEGVIAGVHVGGDDFDETEGLGALTREAAFTGQFTGLAPDVKVGEGGVEAVAGATISSRAVVSGVNTIANCVWGEKLGLLEASDEPYTGQTVSASAQGFAGEVTATVGFAEDGAIEYLSIDTPDETDGLGKLASESAFTGQFIGKTGPFAYGEDGIEAVSGATFTSNAALEAINEIVSGGGAQSAEPVSTTVQGFGGEVTVTVRLNDDGTVAALSVDTPNETDGLGKLASESAFTGQFIGKAGPFALGENGIEAVSGATVTSTAVIDALNSLVPAGAAAPASAEATEETPVDEATEAPAAEATESPAVEATEAPAEEEQPESQAQAALADGSYTAEATNDFSVVNVTIDIADGKIASCEIATSGDNDLMTDELRAAWAAAIVEGQSADVEAITGATLKFSAASVQEAVADILAQAGSGKAETAEPETGEAGDGEAQAALADGSYAAEATNDFSVVNVTIDIAEGKIASCEIATSGDNDLMTDELRAAWAAAIVEGQSADVDVITGATLKFSAASVQEAVADILAQAGSGKAETAEAETGEAEIAEAETGEAGDGEAQAALADGSYTAEATNDFSVVNVTIDIAEGRIASCEIATSGDNDLMTDELRAAWAAAIVEGQSADVDVITGATLKFSAASVQEAVADILAQAAQ